MFVLRVRDKKLIYKPLAYKIQQILKKEILPEHFDKRKLLNQVRICGNELSKNVFQP